MNKKIKKNMRESVDYSYENTKIKEKKWICGMVSREGLGVGYVYYTAISICHLLNKVYIHVDWDKIR